MAKRFFDTQRIEEDWYINLSCKHRELLRYCESKCDGAGVFSFNEKIATTYIGEKITEKDLGTIPVKKLENGKYFLSGFCTFQNGELSEKSPAHKPVFKSLKDNNISGDTLLNTLSDTLCHRVQEKEKEKVIVKERDKEKEKENSEEKEKSLHVQFRELFLSEHKRKRNLEFVWGEEAGKHGKSINGIISQTATLLKSSQGRDPTDTEKLDFFKVLLENLPQWYEVNGFTPAIINSKFNEIVNQIHNKNGKPTKIDDEEFARFAAAGPPKY